MPVVFSIYRENRQTYSIITKMFKFSMIQNHTAGKENDHVI